MLRPAPEAQDSNASCLIPSTKAVGSVTSGPCLQSPGVPDPAPRPPGHPNQGKLRALAAVTAGSEHGAVPPLSAALPAPGAAAQGRIPAGQLQPSTTASPGPVPGPAECAVPAAGPAGRAVFANREEPARRAEGSSGVPPEGAGRTPGSGGMAKVRDSGGAAWGLLALLLVSVGVPEGGRAAGPGGTGSSARPVLVAGLSPTFQAIRL